MNFKNMPLLDRVLNSPTLMTWANFGARILSLSVVIPIVLNRFLPEDVALYYLILSALTIQLLLGSGIVPTFARSISYAMAGAKKSEIGICVTEQGTASGEANLPLVSALLKEMRRLFIGLALLMFLLGSTLGTWLISEPIQLSSAVTHGWIAWGVIICISPIVLWSQHLSAYLQGGDQIAMEQRWAAVFSFGSAISSLIVILSGGKILGLVVSNQVWLLIGVVRISWLANRFSRKIGLPVSTVAGRSGILNALWPQFWRSSVGTISTSLLVQLSGFFYARFADAMALAVYMVGFRLIQMISQISRVPFYSKIPRFNRFRAQGLTERLIKGAQRGMRISYALFIIPWAILLFSGDWILDFLGSQTHFPDKTLWILLGVAFFCERVGAMHIQLYTTTNDVVWHILSGVTFFIMLLLAYPLFLVFGVNGLPISMAIGYGTYFSYRSVRLSTKSLGVGFWSFESRCVIPFAMIFAILSLGSLLWGF